MTKIKHVFDVGIARWLMMIALSTTCCSVIFAEDIGTTSELLDRLTSYLGKPVPRGAISFYDGMFYQVYIDCYESGAERVLLNPGYKDKQNVHEVTISLHGSNGFLRQCLREVYEYLTEKLGKPEYGRSRYIWSHRQVAVTPTATLVVAELDEPQQSPDLTDYWWLNIQLSVGDSPLANGNK